MIGFLTPIHSLLRWAVLLLLLATIIKSLHGMITKRSFSKSDDKISLFMMISAHTQLLVGLLVYFTSPMVQFGNTSNAEVRFFTMEHSTMMIVAIVFMTLARILSKKGKTDASKFNRLFTYSFIALLIILMAIPWPFPLMSQVIRPWF